MNDTIESIWLARYPEKAPKKVKLFLKDLENLYKKYHISIGHEDNHGCFILRDHNKHDVEWINSSSVEIKECNKNIYNE